MRTVFTAGLALLALGAYGGPSPGEQALRFERFLVKAEMYESYFRKELSEMDFSTLNKFLDSDATYKAAAEDRVRKKRVSVCEAVDSADPVAVGTMIDEIDNAYINERLVQQEKLLNSLSAAGREFVAKYMNGQNIAIAEMSAAEMAASRPTYIESVRFGCSATPEELERAKQAALAEQQRLTEQEMLSGGGAAASSSATMGKDQ